MNNNFEKYLGIANHDIQMANTSQELKSYVASILYENDKKVEEIDRLNNIINELDDEIYSLYEDICNSDDTYSYRIPIEIIIDRLVKMTSKIAKFKENEELKDSD